MSITGPKKSRMAVKHGKNRRDKRARFENITGMKYPTKAASKPEVSKTTHDMKKTEKQPVFKDKSSKPFTPVKTTAEKTLIKPSTGKENSNSTGLARRFMSGLRPQAPLSVATNVDHGYDADVDTPQKPVVKAREEFLGPKKQAAPAPAFPRATICLECGGPHHIDDHRDSRVDGRVPVYRFVQFLSAADLPKPLMVCAKCGGDHSMFVHYAGDGDPVVDNYWTEDDRRGSVRYGSRRRNY